MEAATDDISERKKV